MKRKALVIDDDESTLDLLKYQLESKDFEVFTAPDGVTGEKLVNEQVFDIILTDLSLPDIDGIDLVRRCKLASASTEIIMITGYGSVSKAIEATKAGAFYYVEKPVDFDDLYILIEKAVERKQQADEIRELRGRLSSVTSYQGIIGGCKAMQEIYELIENVADSDANILILGESGTGKEVIANAIHYKSSRSGQPFVKVNCSALPKELIESQLFGHVKGAFTGANKDKIGLIGKAKGGSLLLDEIGEMPLDLQPKLLRVLQEKRYYRVGSETPVSADFRLITSTNRDPEKAIEAGDLREDLYYRINTIEIRIPPLRERVDDIPMLAEHFLKIYSDKYGREFKSFSNDAYERLLESDWRGNVRELQHVIERAVLMNKGDRIETLEIQRAGAARRTKAAGASVSSGISVAENFDRPAKDLFEDIGNEIVELLDGISESEMDDNDVFGFLERSVVQAALKKTKGNKKAAAQLLGLYRARLYGMIKRHGIESPK
ncbi:MAG: sigma-54-dependent Fis family transcriptional regulator [Aridibacter famidurans]|nr:sigma-54-dependent Fis family transcriptional regulator [Aridibacter famidurans]